MKQDISMAVPALIPPRAKLMFSSQEETWLATISSSTLFFLFFLNFFFLTQSNDTTLICQHKSKFSLERLTVNWENWTVHVGSPRSEIRSSFYTQPTVPPIRETDTDSKAEWQVLYHQQWQGMEIRKLNYHNKISSILTEKNRKTWKCYSYNCVWKGSSVEKT